jgi:hypothetical protein
MLAAASWATGRALKWVAEWKVELEITKMQTIPICTEFFLPHSQEFLCNKTNTKKHKFKRLASNCNAIYFFFQLQMFHLAYREGKKKHPVLGAVI